MFDNVVLVTYSSAVLKNLKKEAMLLDERVSKVEQEKTLGAREREWSEEENVEKINAKEREQRRTESLKVS